MPVKPNRLPATVMETSTQKPEIPMVSPRILGPMTLPSSCWRPKMKITKYRHFKGSTSRMMKAEGIAPMKGPKKGMTLVTPTTVAMRAG